MRLATRHECASRNTPGSGFRHTAGSGAPKRKRCEGCGETLYTLRGLYGVFVWTGTGRYREADALATFTREADAENDTVTRNPALAGNGGYVVRWISA